MLPLKPEDRAEPVFWEKGRYLTGLAVAFGLLCSGAPARAQTALPISPATHGPMLLCPDGGAAAQCSEQDVAAAISLDATALITARSRCLFQTRLQPEPLCWVISTGTFANMERGGPLTYQHMQIAQFNQPPIEMMVLIETRSSANPRVVAARQIQGYFLPPDLVENKDDCVVFHLVGKYGEGRTNRSDLIFVRKKEGWSEITTDT